jgi:hypothetical protein
MNASGVCNSRAIYDYAGFFKFPHLNRLFFNPLNI